MVVSIGDGGAVTPPVSPPILIGEAKAGLEQVCLSVIPELKVKGSFVIEN